MTALEKSSKRNPSRNSRILRLYRHDLEKRYSSKKYTQGIRKGHGFSRRRGILIRDLVINHLLNCIREYHNLPPVKFEDEFPENLVEGDTLEEKTSENLVEGDTLEENTLKKDLELAEMVGDAREVERIKNLISSGKTGNSKKNEILHKNNQKNKCARCGGSEYMINEGRKVCTRCGAVGENVESELGYSEMGNVFNVPENEQNLGENLDRNAVDQAVDHRINSLIRKMDVYTKTKADKRYSRVHKTIQDCLRENPEYFPDGIEDRESFFPRIREIILVGADKSYSEIRGDILKYFVEVLTSMRYKNVKKSVKVMSRCLGNRKNVEELVPASTQKSNNERRIIDMIGDKGSEKFRENFGKIKKGLSPSKLRRLNRHGEMTAAVGYLSTGKKFVEVMPFQKYSRIQLKIARQILKNN